MKVKKNVNNGIEHDQGGKKSHGFLCARRYWSLSPWHIHKEITIITNKKKKQRLRIMTTQSGFIFSHLDV